MGTGRQSGYLFHEDANVGIPGRHAIGGLEEEDGEEERKRGKRRENRAGVEVGRERRYRKGSYCGERGGKVRRRKQRKWEEKEGGEGEKDEEEREKKRRPKKRRSKKKGRKKRKKKGTERRRGRVGASA